MEARKHNCVQKGFLLLLLLWYSGSSLLAILSKSYPGTKQGKMDHDTKSHKNHNTHTEIPFIHPSSVKYSLFLISVTLLLEPIPAVTRQDASTHPGLLASPKQGKM